MSFKASAYLVKRLASAGASTSQNEANEIAAENSTSMPAVREVRSISSDLIVHSALVIDPGVSFLFKGCFSIVVEEGAMLSLHGTAEEPVHLHLDSDRETCGLNHSAILKRSGGILYMVHTNIDGFGTGVNSRGEKLKARGCTFRQNGYGVICEDGEIHASTFDENYIEGLQATGSGIVADSIFMNNEHDMSLSFGMEAWNNSVTQPLEATDEAGKQPPLVVVGVTGIFGIVALITLVRVCASKPGHLHLIAESKLSVEPLLPSKTIECGSRAHEPP